MNARDFLRLNLKIEYDRFFGPSDERFISTVCDAWMNDTANSEHRFRDMKLFLSDAAMKEAKILDMSSGCGTFVFYGLLHNFDVFGVEPEKWKHSFNMMKAREKGYPSEWNRRFCQGVGEFLPFKDGAFDLVSTYQTLEHVQSLARCFSEFKRVLKPGGWLFIECPDYRSFFEGHYRVPMLPLMNKAFFKFYLKTLGRQTAGLSTLSYVTRASVVKQLGQDYEVHNMQLVKIRRKILCKTGLDSSFLSLCYTLYSALANMFRRENSVCLAAKKKCSAS